MKLAMAGSARLFAPRRNVMYRLNRKLAKPFGQIKGRK
jgi:hypothetical protein